VSKPIDLYKFPPFQNALLEEPLESRQRRMLAGALYGLLSGTAYTFLSGTIDALLHPDLPIYIHWSGISFMWAWLGLGLAFFGALTGWFTETLKGVAIGAIAMSLIVLAANLAQSSVQGAFVIVALLILLLPVAAACSLLAWALRWLAERHVRTLAESDSKKRMRSLILLVAVALAIGFIPAAVQRMSAPAEQSVRLLDGLLKQAAASQTGDNQGLPLDKLPAFKAHLGMEYKLSQASSKISTVGYDIGIIYSDGYKITCVLVAYGDQKPYLRGCVEGDIKPQNR
jgi:MFS family permease